MGVLVGKISLKLRQRAPLVPPGGSVTASPLRSASFLAKLAIAKNMFTNQHRTSRTGGDCAEKLVPRSRRGLGGPPRYSTPALGLMTRRAHLALQRYDSLFFEFIGRTLARGLDTKIPQLNSTSYDRSQVSLGTSLAFRISATIASARISTSSSNGKSPYKFGLAREFSSNVPN